MSVEISDWNDLDNVRNDLNGDYVLVNDLDSETDGYAGIGDDFTPIAVGLDDGFNGTFDGDGFAINDLVVEIDADSVGLFGTVNRSTENTVIIENLSVSGSVTNTGTERRTGGLAGNLDSDGDGEIKNCVSHVDVTSDGDRVGGLVGTNRDIVTDSYATGSVEGGEEVGGLVGLNSDSSTVTESYATGSVEGEKEVGGLVGSNSLSSTVTESYATGSVEGGDIVGGLVALNRGGSTVTDSYATGSVEGGEEVGGLVGSEMSNDSDAGIRRCYSYGTVTGSSDVGGFCGTLGVLFEDGGYIFDSYVDIDESEQDDAIGSIENEGESDVTELSTSQMQGSEAETNMDGFDFADVWDAVLASDDDASDDGYPILLSIDREVQLEAQGIFDPLDPPEPPANLTAELL